MEGSPVRNNVSPTASQAQLFESRMNTPEPPPVQTDPKTKPSWFSRAKYKFKNQKLPAWRPVYSHKYVIPIFFLVGVVFIPVGAMLIVLTKDRHEVVKEYTNCRNDLDVPCKDVVADIDNQISGAVCHCSVEFNIGHTIDKDVYFYYGLRNFFQNHRRYVESRDDSQLIGEEVTEVSDDCKPYDKARDPLTNETLPIAPCGAIANSFFNDTFELYCVTEEGEPDIYVPMLKTGIAWKVDRNAKFQNPSGSGSLQSRFEGTTRPPNWHKYVWELDESDESNNGFENEDFIVWMRTSVLSQFRKPHRRVDHNANEAFKNGLPAGKYRLEVNYSYPVTEFDGKKYIILSGETVVGGFSPFLGVMYASTGGLSLIVSLFMIVLHWKYAMAAKIMKSRVLETNDMSASVAHLTSQRSGSTISG